jgi:hypothetical protein
MIKKILILFFLGLTVLNANAESCNRTDQNSGDYVAPDEFCIDDFSGKKLPKFKNFRTEKISATRPVFPNEIPDTDGDQEWADSWKEAISSTYKNEGINFSGHYLFVRRGCGSSCQLGLIVDLTSGKAYRPPEIAKIIASVNPLSKNALKKLDIVDYEVFTFNPNSNLLVVMGSFGEETEKRGIYYLKWEDNKFKLISKIEKTQKK